MSTRRKTKAIVVEDFEHFPDELDCGIATPETSDSDEWELFIRNCPEGTIYKGQVLILRPVSQWVKNIPDNEPERYWEVVK